MLRMISSRLEGKHASCRFSTAGATESHATDAVAFVAALLASQFMLLVTCRKKGGEEGIAEHHGGVMSGKLGSFQCLVLNLACESPCGCGRGRGS